MRISRSPAKVFTLAFATALTLTGIAVSSSALGQAPSGDPTKFAGIEQFVDEFFAAQLPLVHGLGATISIVEGGKLRYLQGYGFADIAKSVPIDAERHLFKIASITKTVTATAILQLVESGALDLDRDVNDYLKTFQLEDTFASPVTSRHLLWHTAGLDDDYIDIGLKDSANHQPMGEFFRDRVPNRVRAPGRVHSYTNRAYMLLGHIVEAVSGQSYEDYVQTHILDPLQMHNSYIAPNEAPAAQMVQGTTWLGGEYVPVSLADTQTRPSSDLVTTAADMAHYMLAYLNGGNYAGNQIMQAATVDQAFNDCFKHHPLMNAGMCLGFHSFQFNGEPLLGHGGNHYGFKSQVLLVPERKLGIFYSYSSENGSLHGAFIKAFTERYFPAGTTPEPAETTRPAPARAGDIEGSYRALRSSQATIEYAMNMLSNDLLAKVDADGVLSFSGQKFTELEPLVFQHAENQGVLAFLEDDAGRVEYATFPNTSFRKLSWWETIKLHRRAVLAALAILLAAFFAWPIQLLRARTAGRSAQTSGDRLVIRLGALNWLTATAWLGAFIGTVLAARGGLNAWTIMYGLPGSMRFALALPYVAAAGTVLALVAAAFTWRRITWARLQGLGFVLTLTASAVLIAWAAYWNIL